MFLFGIITLCVLAVNGEKHYVVQGSTSSNAFDVSHPTDECLDSESTEPKQDTSRGWGIAVRCCSMDGSTGYSPDCQSHGASGATYDDAEQLCASHGLRLCTRDEALSGVAESTGCKYDHVYHWVSDECGDLEIDDFLDIQTFEEWKEITSAVSLCDPITWRDTANPATPSQCPDGYTHGELGEWKMMCLEECPNGWSSNPDIPDPMCWKDCPSGWNAVLGFCENLDEVASDKGSIDRGVGVIPNACGSNKVKEGGLCYNKCPSGWTAFGCFCYEGAVFFSKSQGRGCGTAPNKCPSSHPSLEGGLCYKNCPSSHPEGVGHLCWEDCESRGADVIDMGVYCQHPVEVELQDTMDRASKPLTCAEGELVGVSEIGVGVCMLECPEGYVEVAAACVLPAFGNTVAAIALTSAQLAPVQICYSAVAPLAYSYLMDLIDSDIIDIDTDFTPFLDCAWTLIETMAMLDSSWSQDNGVTVAVTVAATAKVAQLGLSPYYGLAFEFVDDDNVRVWHYGGVCGSSSLMASDPQESTFGASLSAGMSIYRSVGDIKGDALFLTMGASILTPIGINVDVGSTWSFDDECSITGMTATSGISTPTSGAASGTFEIGICHNPHLEQIGGDLQSPKASSSAMAPDAARSIAIETNNQHHGDDGKVSRSFHNEEEEGEFVLELNASSLVIVALCVVLFVMTAILCWQCRGRGGRGVVYNKVEMATDSDMEAVVLNEI